MIRGELSDKTTGMATKKEISNWNNNNNKHHKRFHDSWPQTWRLVSNQQPWRWSSEELPGLTQQKPVKVKSSSIFFQRKQRFRSQQLMCFFFKASAGTNRWFLVQKKSDMSSFQHQPWSQKISQKKTIDWHQRNTTCPYTRYVSIRCWGFCPASAPFPGLLPFWTCFVQSVSSLAVGLRTWI